MKRYALAAVLAAFALPAIAADLPTLPRKAPVLAFDCSLSTYCIGPTLSVRMTGLNSNIDVLGSGVAGSFGAGGMSIGADAGFQLWNGNYFIAGTLGADRDMVSNTNVIGGSPLDRWLILEKIKVGMNLAGAFGLAPGGTAQPSPSAGGPLLGMGITVPADLLKSLTSMYVVGGAAQRHGVGSGPLTGAGAQFLISAQVTAEMEYNHIDWSKAVNFGAIPGMLKTEDRMVVGATYHFRAH